MSLGVVVVAVVAGLIVGSFLTVVTDRVPRGASVVAPGSACGSCGLRLGPLDLVPLLSWVVLRGRCRRCRTSIGVEAPLLELTTAALFVACGVRFNGLWAVAAYCTFAAGLIALSVIDLRTKRLPREVTYTTAALGIPLLVVSAVVEQEPRRIVEMSVGAGLALAFMLAVYLASRGGMGDGDVRLSPLLGAYLGWLGLGFVAVGLFLGFLLGAVTGVAAMALGRAGRKTALPFGPFLAAGSFLAVFVGRPVINLVWAG